MILSYAQLSHIRTIAEIVQQVWESFHLSTTLQETSLSLIIPFTGTHESSKLTWWHLSGFIAQLVSALHWHRKGHGFESCQRHLKFLGCTFETIAEIIHQVWGSFLQFICPFLPARIKSWKCLLMELSCHQAQIRSNPPANELHAGSCLLFLNTTQLFSFL